MHLYLNYDFNYKPITTIKRFTDLQFAIASCAGEYELGDVQVENMLAALQLVKQHAREARKSDDALTITVQLLEQWHSVLARGDQYGGISRKEFMPNVGSRDGHIYVLSHQVQYMLQMFCDTFNEMAYSVDNNSFYEIIKYSAWAYYVSVSIHGFMDFNGRLSRLLSAYVLFNITPVPVPLLLDHISAIKNTRANAKNLFDCKPSAIADLIYQSLNDVQ